MPAAYRVPSRSRMPRSRLLLAVWPPRVPCARPRLGSARRPRAPRAASNGLATAPPPPASCPAAPQSKASAPACMRRANTSACPCTAAMNSAVAPSGARNVDLGLRLEQQRHQKRVALVRRMHQRRPAPGVARVHVGPGRNRHVQVHRCHLPAPRDAGRREVAQRREASLRERLRPAAHARATPEAHPASECPPQEAPYRAGTPDRLARCVCPRCRRAPQPDIPAPRAASAPRESPAAGANPPPTPKPRQMGSEWPVRCRPGWAPGCHAAARCCAAPICAGVIFAATASRSSSAAASPRLAREVEPHVRLHVVLEHAQTLPIPLPQRQHRPPIARVRRCAPLRQGFVQMSGVRRALPRLEIGPGRLHCNKRRRQKCRPDR